MSTMHGGNWLTVTDVRLSQANQLLGASYQLYRNIKTNETIIRTVGYSLPTVLHTHIQTVTPTTCFPSMQVTLQSPHRRTFGPAPAQATAASGNLGTRLQPPPPPPIVEPAIVRGMYGTAQYEPAAYYGPGRNRFGVVGEEHPRWDDLTDFMIAFQAESVAANFDFENVDLYLIYPGPTSSVAIQYASAMAYPTPLTYYGTSVDENLLARFLDLLLDEPVVIQTLSISYNYFTELVMPPQLADSICDKFARLGARGTSVLVASGNWGVGNGDCEDGEGNIKFVAEFPSSCTSGIL